MNKEVIGSREEIRAPKSFEDYWRQAQISFKSFLEEFDGDVFKAWEYVEEIEAINLEDYYYKAERRAKEEPSRKNSLIVKMLSNTLETAIKEVKVKHTLPKAAPRHSHEKRDIFPHRMAVFFYNAENKILEMGIDTGEESPFLELEKVLKS